MSFVEFTFEKPHGVTVNTKKPVMIMANESEKGKILPFTSIEEKSATISRTQSKSELTTEAEPKVVLLDDLRKGVPGRLTGCLAFTSIVATLASFQFGYHIGCVNAPGTLIQTWFQKSHKDLFDSHLNEDNAKLAWSVAVSMFAVGGMIGGLSVGWLADKFGRRGAMMYNNLLALAAAALMGLAKSVNVYPMIIIGRLIIGLNAGISSGLVPMYLTEVSPINLRGTLGSLPQLLVTIAILVSQIYGHPSLLGDDQKWPLIFAFTIVPAVLQLVLLAFCPESPKYLISVRGQPEKATASLKKLRGTDDVTDEINLMLEEAAAQQQAEKVSIGAMFKANLRWPITIAIIMMFAQQFSGINVVMFYSTFIFTQAGLTGDEPFYATIGVGVVNVLMTVVSVYIVEKFGRRPLMLTGLVGMFITTASLVGALSGIYAYENEKWISYVAIVIVFAFVIAFATGPGSIPWFFVSEIFDSSARGSANSIAVMTNWLANLLVSLSFLPLNNLLKQYTFLMFTTLLGVFIFFTAKFVPETKGRTLEQIQAAMKH